MPEKRKPTHDLEAFRGRARSSRFSITGSALRSATALGCASKDVVAAVQTIERRHFATSMTSHADHREWQDVYHVPSAVGLLYVEFRDDLVTELLLLSFKEKSDG